MKKAIYSAAAFTPLDAPDLPDGSGVIVLLDYYRSHHDEIQAEFAEQHRAFEQMERQWQEYVDRHGGNPPDVPSPEDRGIARPVEAQGLVDAVRSTEKEARPFAHPIRFIRIRQGGDEGDPRDDDSSREGDSHARKPD